MPEDRANSQPGIDPRIETPVRIREGAKRIVLHPNNDDLFVWTGKQVIEACHLNIEVDVWLGRLGEMFNYVGAWCEKNPRVRCCYAAATSKVVLFFAPVGGRFDFALADEMTQLHFALDEFKVGMIEVRQIPFSEISRFIDPVKAHSLYGGSPRAHSAVEA